MDSLPHSEVGPGEKPIDQPSLDYFFEQKYFSLLKSFESIFNLLQRSEESRSHVEELCRILVTSRTVTGLIAGVARTLRERLDLTVVRIVFREDHPVAGYRGWDPPDESGTIQPELFESESIEGDSPFVIDNPSGKLSRTLFKADRRMVASAVTASLHAHGLQMGLLCLASDDPSRFAGGMNTEAVAFLAEIVSLGILNAWEHEKRDRAALTGCVDGFCSEVAFQQLLTIEFARAHRYGRPFTIAAVSWDDPEAQEDRSMGHVIQLLRTHTRSSDVVAVGDNITVWFLLPESGAREALNLVQRLCAASKDLSTGTMMLHAGITQFTADVAAPADLARECRLALQDARQHDHDCAIVRTVITEAGDSDEERPSLTVTHTSTPAGPP